MNRQRIALALALLVSSSEAVLAQRTGRGAAAGNLAEELANCVRAVAPSVARPGMQMTVRLHENGSLADAPAFRSAGSPLPPAQMHDAIGRLRRCFPVGGVERYRYQYREWQTLVISFGDAAEPAPSSPAGPRDNSGAPHREPSSSPNPASASRVAHVQCEDLQRMDPLTVASWATLSRAPLLQLTYDELQELKIKARACWRRPNLTFSSMRALSKLDDSFDGLSTALKKREAEARVAEQRRREAEAADRLVQEATTELQGIVSAQSGKDPFEACNPTTEEIERRLEPKLGEQLFHHGIRGTSLWRQFDRDCRQRLGRAQETARRAAAEKQKASVAQLHSAVFDYAARSREEHREVIDQLGIPVDMLDAPMNLKPGGPATLFLFDLDTARITVAQWLGMILAAKSDIRIEGLRDRWAGLYGFSLKEPGQRTMGFYLQKDGDDVFVSRFQSADSWTDVQSPVGNAMVSTVLFSKTAISQIIMGQQPGRQ